MAGRVPDQAGDPDSGHERQEWGRARDSDLNTPASRAGDRPSRSGGEVFGSAAFVFGNEIGQRVASPKKAWATAVLKAHGHTPTWVKGSLSPDSRAAYRAIDLRFHDLRHEHGSRLLGWGWSLLDVRDQLGHADVSTTNTYLNAGKHQRQDLMRKTDELRARCNLVTSEAPIGESPRPGGEAGTSPKSLLH